MRTRLLLGTMVFAACVVGLAVAQQSGRPRDRGVRDGSAPPPPPPGGFPPNPVIEALDTDKDGTISAAEMQKAASNLAKLDGNGDGALTPDELRPSPDGRERPGPAGGPPDGPGFGDARSDGRATIADAPPAPKDEAEKKILDVLTSLDRDQRRGMMNVPIEDGRLLRLLAESIGAKQVVEIGTSNGYSGIWLCLALRTTGGKLITHEIDAQRAALARRNFKQAGVEGMVTLVEGNAHEKAKDLKGTIDLLFLDADKEGYLDYLTKLLPLVRPGGLVVAHNMSRGMADPKYVKAITTNPELETLFLHMQGAGIGVTLKKR
jgi:caffeoyl-CoA O-methyltransferase